MQTNIVLVMYKLPQVVFIQHKSVGSKVGLNCLNLALYILLPLAFSLDSVCSVIGVISGMNPTVPKPESILSVTLGTSSSFGFLSLSADLTP